MTELENLIADQLELYADRILYFTNIEPNAELAEFFSNQAQDLLDHEESDEFMVNTYHRHLSESYGVVFEQAHGDPELMFGGV